MKKYYIKMRLIFILILVAQSLIVRSQIISTIGNELLEEDIVTEKGRDVFIQYYEVLTSPKYSDVLSILSEIYGKEYLDRLGIYESLKQVVSNPESKISLSQTDSISNPEINIVLDKELYGLSFQGVSMYPPFVQGLRLDDKDLVPLSQSVLGKNLYSLSDKLMRMGLINEEDKINFLSRLKDKLPSESGMLTYYSFLLKEREEKPKRDQVCVNFYQKLKELDLVDNNLLVNYQGLNEPFDVLSFSNSSVIFNLAELPIDAKEGYQIIYSKIGELLNEKFDLVDFSLEVFPEPNSKTSRIDAIITINNRGNQYYDTIYYNYAGGNTSLEDGMKTKYTDRLVNILNDVLRINNSEKRLYFLYPERFRTRERAAILALNRNQYYRVLGSKDLGHLWGVHPEQSLCNLVSSEIIDEAVELEIVKEESRDKIMEDSSSSFVSSILRNSEVGFPSFYKIENLNNSKIFQLFESASNGDLSFNDIKFKEYSEDELLCMFKVGTVTHEVILSNAKSYDYALIQYLSKYVEIDGYEHSFYYVGDGNEDIGIYYLNKDQKKWIDDNGYNLWLGKFSRKK